MEKEESYGKAQRDVGIKHKWRRQCDYVQCCELLNTLNKRNAHLSLSLGKHGFKTEEVVDAAKFLTEKCDQLRLTGLMTIGSSANSLQNVKPNPDFQVRSNRRCDKLRRFKNKFTR